MGFWRKLFNKEKREEKVDNIKTSKTLDENLRIIKEDFLKDCSDVVYREIKIGVEGKYRAVTIYVDGLANNELVNQFVLNNLMTMARVVKPDVDEIKNTLHDLAIEQNIAVTELEEVESIDEAILSILIGETALLLDNYDKIVILGTRGWPTRSPSEPETATVVRGSRDGLVESLRMNTTLIRRRVRDHRLKVKSYQVGTRSKTDVAMMYIEDLVDKRLLEELDKRLQAVDYDAILDSGILEEFIEDKWISPFPQIENTERPDTAASALYHGRVVLVVDNTPFVLIVPTTFNSLVQSSEDYYERWGIATALRILRYFCCFVALFAPTLYVAVVAYHPRMLPTSLALDFAGNRGEVPFPGIIEALIMEITIEILREAGVRLPGAIGSTIGIVGGLVIGQAAVEAGLVSPFMVIIVAITAISSFTIPNYNLAVGFRVLRFVLLFAGAFMGLYGIMLMALVILIHLCSLKSFDTPYLSPFITFMSDPQDLKDTVVRAPHIMMNNRSSNVPKGKRNRLDDKRSEDFNIEEK